MSLPTTGGNWATELEPTVNPLAVRYWQVTDVLIRDYYNADGTVFSLADESVGLGAEGLFTPFALDGTIRDDLLIYSAEANQGFYHLGLLKEDTTAVSPEQTVQETPTAQYVRTVRNVLTKLDDKVNFTPLEASPLVDYLHYELELSRGIPDIGTAGYQVVRPPTDQLVERIIVLLGVDGNGQLLGKVYPRVITDKKGKTELQRKNPESLELTYSILPDPYSQASEWTCREGVQWRALGGVPKFSTTAPVATAASGAKATISFAVPTGNDMATATYAVTQQVGGTGAFTASTLQGSPTIADGTVTLTVTGLTASSNYVFVVTATGDNDAVATSPPSNSIAATA